MLTIEITVVAGEDNDGVIELAPILEHLEQLAALSSTPSSISMRSRWFDPGFTLSGPKLGKTFEGALERRLVLGRHTVVLPSRNLGVRVATLEPIGRDEASCDQAAGTRMKSFVRDVEQKRSIALPFQKAQRALGEDLG